MCGGRVLRYNPGCLIVSATAAMCVDLPKIFALISGWLAFVFELKWWCLSRV